MRTFITILLLILVCSCADSGNSEEINQLQLAVEQFESEKAQEEATKRFIEEYVKAMNSENWSAKMLPFLKKGEATDNFLKEHQQFRRAFANLNATINHMVVNGNEAIVWLEETATFVEPYAYQDSDYGDGVLNGIKANNQSLKWTEVWYFDVVDGKFGDKFDFLKDNYAVLKGLGQLDN